MAGETIHYRTVFSVSLASEETCDLDAAIEVVFKWISGKLGKLTPAERRRFFAGAPVRTDPEVHKQVITRRYVPPPDSPHDECWALRLNERDRDIPDYRNWHTDIGLSRDGARVLLAVTVSHSMRPGHIGVQPSPPFPTAPALVSFFLDVKGPWLARAGDELLVDTPLGITEGDVDQFLANLYSKTRKCPLVYLSRTRDSQRLLLDAVQLARVLKGAASVYVAGVGQVGQNIEKKLPPALRGWDGAVTVYQPGIELDNAHEGRRHRRFWRREIEERGADTVSDFLVRGLVRHPKLWIRARVASLGDVDEAIRTATIHQQIQEARSQTKEVIPTEWLNEFEDQLRENASLKETLRNLEERMEEQSTSHEAEIAIYKYRLTAIDEQEEPTAGAEQLVDALAELPRSVGDVLELAGRLFDGRLVILPDARESAAACGFPDPAKVWRCLWHMGMTLPGILFYEQAGNPEIEFRNASGFDLSFAESKATNNDAKFAAQRKRMYLGQTVDITPHIKIDSKGQYCRIYFFVDREREKIVIGHCGDHLDTAGTRRRK